ncbi:MAG: hypothetical protein AABY15_07150 [Nanoarchaeota archaeon]
MEEKEKLKDAEQKLTCQISEDGGTFLIFDEISDELICRMRFYKEGLELTLEEKREIGKKTIENIFSILDSRKNKTWEYRCEAFKEAYQYQTKNKPSISWLMKTVLGVSEEEAGRRFDIANELMSHPDFKDKEDLIVEKIYLNIKTKTENL